MRNPTISIIVPVYNVKPYLKKCIKSILNQTLKDFELLLIDDGSTDGSEKICDKFAKQDSRIKVFHQKNQGISSARNVGLKEAKSEWIGFVDSDDWCSEKMFEVLLKNAKEYKVKLSICGFENAQGEIRSSLFDTLNSGIMSSNSALNILFNRFYFILCCNCLIDRNFLSKSNIKFENFHNGEDTLFYFEILKKIENIYLSTEVLYHYRCRENSASTNSTINNTRLLELNIYNLMIKKETDSKILKGIWGMKMTKVIFYCSFCIVNKSRARHYRYLLNIIKQNFIHIIISPKIRIKSKLVAILVFSQKLCLLMLKIKTRLNICKKYFL